MRCLKKEAPREGLTLTTARKPRAKAGEVLIRVTHAGICGTDIHIYNWDRWSQSRLRPPLITGHEFVGLIEELGEGVEGLQKGQRVSAEGHITCGRCEYCRTGNGHICANVKIIGIDRDGAFAEWLAMPAGNVWPVDDRIPDEQAAIFDPLGNAMHTVASANMSGANVLIVGAGAIGLFAIPIARSFGARAILVAEPNAYRRELAAAAGADLVVDPRKEPICDAVRREFDAHGVDVVLEMSGHPEGFRQGLASLRGGGTAVLLGIPSEPLAIDWAADVIFKAITIVGVNGRRMFDTWYQTSRFLVSNGSKIAPLITHRMDMARYEEAFTLLRAGNAGKIVLDIA
ncbi:MAG: L-threonine 3-dehydrogenase [Candidatus Sumerlaeia bacterium]|nr:L-threonine 3-dehydrogenase [Candidatus Sumerlaeia bacterium]